MVADQNMIFFLKSVVFSVYSLVFVVSVIFTLSLEKYYTLERFLGTEFLHPTELSIFERNISSFNDWLIAHNKQAGPLLIILSFLDIFVLFGVVDLLFA